MKLSARLKNVQRIFLDTAPVIYYVEKNPAYLARVKPVFARIDAGTLAAVTSPITLSECLVHPYRLQHVDGIARFRDLIVGGSNVNFVLLDDAIADKAAELRAQHGLTLPDALQAATALSAGCDAFLTNDPILMQVTGLNVIVVDQVEVP
jgi:predicted nucleic acid-binding protein